LCYWEQTPEGFPQLVVEFVNAPYWYFVKNGRQPGTPITRTRLTRSGTQVNYQSFTKFPPLDAIEEWISQKPVTNYTDNLGRVLPQRTMAYLIGRSIAREGFQGVDFIEEAWQASRNVLLPLFGEAVAEYFTDIIRENILIVTTE
jgi:hypothetical protein